MNKRGDKIASVCKVDSAPEEEIAEEDEQNNLEIVNNKGMSAQLDGASDDDLSEMEISEDVDEESTSYADEDNL